MPSRAQTISDAVAILDEVLALKKLLPENAWLGVYQALLWCEPIELPEPAALPHIIETNDLRESQAWQSRARAMLGYLAKQLDCDERAVPSKLDLLMASDPYRGMQRQNTLGIAFAGLIRYILDSTGNPGATYELEADPTFICPRILFPGRSSAPTIDILVSKADIPRAIISCKWSLRHDRMNDITNECPVYKAAHHRVFRGHGDMLFYVATHEFNPGRLNKMLGDSCIDGVIHVHKPAVVDVCRLNGRTQKLIDLADFIELTKAW